MAYYKLTVSKRHSDILLYQNHLYEINDLTALNKTIETLKEVEMKLHFPEKYDVKLYSYYTNEYCYKSSYKYNRDLKEYRPYHSKMSKMKKVATANVFSLINLIWKYIIN